MVRIDAGMGAGTISPKKSGIFQDIVNQFTLHKGFGIILPYNKDTKPFSSLDPITSKLGKPVGEVAEKTSKAVDKTVKSVGDTVTNVYNTGADLAKFLPIMVLGIGAVFIISLFKK
jgi:hypothetical protein